ncbi:phosphohistidine phosphatase SixA [Paraferrimonas haliotis]|uniref:Phosphohistidine phosphatase SixA n=1 Tax=Paraferrimonas haliotis TaxID=2013866 RepID=A0AA37TMU2_9GAMM|nr:phosphohistidine phosphatase SixA [Paraferrimonas haliotis]GLS82613.1 phosphohistidine phosphatase SixA [Paraferrimonas haliotis]
MSLFLMRHGDASFNASTDEERTLSETGIRQVNAMGCWLSTQAERFDLVCVSPYLRAQQTWQKLNQSINHQGTVHILDELRPNASADDTADLISAMIELHQSRHTLVVSHMPLLGYLCSELLPGTEPKLFATAAIAKIDKKHDGMMLKMQLPKPSPD